MVRAFTAIDLDQETKKAIFQQVKVLMDGFRNLKWVQPNHFHLTLHFLGDVDRGMLELVKGRLIQRVRKVPSFPITLTSLGAFPNLNTPKVIWIGVGQGEATLKRLYGQIDRGLGELGFKGEGKPYHPHLTIGRCRKEIPKGLSLGIRGLTLEELTFTAYHVTLFKSKLTPRGPLYTKLQTFELGGKKG